MVIGLAGQCALKKAINFKKHNTQKVLKFSEVKYGPYYISDIVKFFIPNFNIYMCVLNDSECHILCKNYNITLTHKKS